MKSLYLLVFISLSATASAQAVDSERTRKVMQSFGKCVVSKNMSQVKLYLDNPEKRMPGGLGDSLPGCLVGAGGDQLTSEGNAFRLALTEAYVTRKFRDGRPEITLNEAQPVSSGTLEALGNCIVQKAPTESWALLRTNAVTTSESAAFEALMPAMKFCVREGLTLEMNKFFVRGAVADAYYRMSTGDALKQGAKR